MIIVTLSDIIGIILLFLLAIYIVGIVIISKIDEKKGEKDERH